MNATIQVPTIPYVLNISEYAGCVHMEKKHKKISKAEIFKRK